jgi:hypothetical protein
MQYTHTQQGFVILFSVLISASVLLIGFGMFSASYKSTVLSSVGRESIVAFYAASSGVECAFWAMHTNPTGLAGVSQINCLPAPSSSVLDISGVISFDFSMPNSRSCVRVSIADHIDPNTNIPYDKIVSRGYNICNSSNNTPDINDPLLVERVLQVFLPKGGGSGSQQFSTQAFQSTGVPPRTRSGVFRSDQNSLNTFNAVGRFSGSDTIMAETGSLDSRF